MVEKKNEAKTGLEKSVVKKSSVKKAANNKKTVVKKAKQDAPSKAKNPASKKSGSASKSKIAVKQNDQPKENAQVMLVGMDEVASMLRIPVLQVRRLVQSGKIPAVKLDGEWRFNKDLVYAAYHRRAMGR